MRNSELHDTYDYLSCVDEPSYEEIQELEKNHILTDINQTENLETLDMEDFHESFIEIGELSSCLLDFSRTGRGYRRKVKAMGDEKNISLNELHLTKRIQSLLEKINIRSISDLLYMPTSRTIRQRCRRLNCWSSILYLKVAAFTGFISDRVCI